MLRGETTSSWKRVFSYVRADALDHSYSNTFSLYSSSVQAFSRCFAQRENTSTDELCELKINKGVFWISHIERSRICIDKIFIIFIIYFLLFIVYFLLKNNFSRDYSLFTIEFLRLKLIEYNFYINYMIQWRILIIETKFFFNRIID